LTAAWVWQKSALLATDGIVQDRSAQMLLQRTLICEACYECVVRDGGIQMDEGWWIFDAEYVKHKDAEDNPLKHAEPSEPAGVSVDNHIEGNLDEINWLPADASQEWHEGVKASLELKQFEWRKIVEESLESFEQEEVKRAATEAKFNDQLESDLISAAGQSLYEGRRDRIEQAAGPAHPATQLAVTRTQVDRQKVNGDKLAERRKEAEKEEVENQKQRDLVEERRKAAGRVRTAVMALIDVKCAQAEDGSKKGKGTKNRPWQTTLSTHELELVKIEILLERAREAGVDEVELQLTLQACGPHSW
jgi:hypothetical protein